MSTLYARLLAELDGFDRLLVHPVRFNVALRAVVELHKPVTFSRPRSGEPQSCRECGTFAQQPVPWPCSTIQAIARELGVPEGDTK